MGAKTYSPKDIIATVGPCILRGFADGAMVKLARDVDQFSKTVGADGEVTRIESANESGTLTVSLAASSDANDELSILSASGACVPVTVKDLGGRTLAFAPNGWVRKPADVSFGKSLDDREWVLDLDKLKMFIGGTDRGSILGV